MGKIYWSLIANQDLEEIADFIAKDSPFYAINFVEKVLQYVERLTDFPELGRIVPEFNQENIRELIFHNYRIVYKLENDNIFIVSVSHGSMNILRKSRREKWEIS